jgi:hypothetical protein
MTVPVWGPISPPDRPALTQLVLDFVDSLLSLLTGRLFAIAHSLTLLSARLHQLTDQALPSLSRKCRVRTAPKTPSDDEISAIRCDGIG